MSRKDEHARAVDVVSKTLMLGPWQEASLRRELQALLGRHEGWITAVLRELLWAHPEKPSHDAIKVLLESSSTLGTAVQRSRSLRECVPTWARVAERLGAALVQVEWSESSIRKELARKTGSKARWTFRIARELLHQLGGTQPNETAIASSLLESDVFHEVLAKSSRLRAMARDRGPARMNAAPGPPQAWRVPALLTPSEVSDWLSVPLTRLLRLANGRGEYSSTEAARNYRYRWTKKRTGGWRLLESPKAHLKQVQHDISGGILAQIPAHDAAHGFCVGRNIQSYASPHVGKELVLRLDLKDFFASITAARVAAVFRTAGYPQPVVNLLVDLLTNRTPRHVLEMDRWSRDDVDLYRKNHLPQGSPASPALANLCAFRLDCRLKGLATRFSATYTRYADDILFSGDEEFARGARRFHVFALATILDEGLLIQPRKTRQMRRGVRQHATGLVLNDRLNVGRRDYKRLKAILHNCAKHGAESQNRWKHENFRQHLQGLVSFHNQINPQRGQRLKRAFDLAFPD